jgi:hypothetical protein
MTPADSLTAAETFEAALDRSDFPSACIALDQYLDPLRTGGGPLAEIARARDLIATSLRAVVARRTVLARDLARLRQLQGGYRARPAANTWEISG